MSVTSNHRLQPKTSCSSSGGSIYAFGSAKGFWLATNDGQSCAHCPVKHGTARSMIQLSPTSVPNLLIFPCATDEVAKGSWKAGMLVSFPGAGFPSAVFERYGQSEG